MGWYASGTIKPRLGLGLCSKCSLRSGRWPAPGWQSEKASLGAKNLGPPPSVEKPAAEGVHLDHAGEVSTETPAEVWGWENKAPALAQRQRFLSRRRAEAARARLFETLQPAAHACLRACGGAGAGGCVLATPTGTATRLTDFEFKICAYLRLHVPLHLEAAGRRCLNQRGGSLGRQEEAAAPRGVSA